MKRFRISINRRLIDKNVAGEKILFTDGFENVEPTLPELAGHLRAGHAFCAQLNGPRRAENFLAADVVTVDIDGGMTIEQALEHPLVKEHAGLIYTTVSHTPEAHRFRIVFPTARTITDAREQQTIQRSLALRLGGDSSATDATRISYGNRAAEFLPLDGTLTVELMDELKAQSINQTRTASMQGSETTRSALLLNAQQLLQVAGGPLVRLDQLEKKTAVHCPFHADRNASAFVIENRRGLKGVYCSACRDAFWPDRGPDDVDFTHFDRAVRAARADFDQHQDHGPLGPILNSPQARVGLFACNIAIVHGAPAPPELLPGLTLIKSPKGSGKTESLRRLIAGKNRVLVVGHRRSLIREICRRLGLNCYQDDKDLSEGVIARRQERYAVCLDSLLRVPLGAKYDVVIIDESEQVIGHFFSDTIDKHGSSRGDIFRAFRELLERAKSVVALDADLGWLTLNTLARMMERSLPDVVEPDLFTHDGPAVRLWLNDEDPSAGRTVQVYRSQAQLRAEVHAAAASGSRIFVAANSKRLINEIAASLADRLPNVRQLVITSDTRTGEAQVAFLNNAREEALKYDAILVSPALGTGIDLTFAGGAQEFDVVFGFCCPGITDAFAFDQQIGRVRNPGEIKVWVTPAEFNFETNADAVRQELLEGELFRHLLIDRRGPGRAALYTRDDPMLEAAVIQFAGQRASMNGLRRHFIAHKRRQGFNIVFVEADDALVVAGKELASAGKRLGDAAFLARIMAAEPLRKSGFRVVSQAIEAGQVVPDDRWWSLQRTRIELFYRRPISAALIEIDDKGRYRARLSLLDLVQMKMVATSPFKRDQQIDRRQCFLRTRGETGDALAGLLKMMPLVRDGVFDVTAVFTGADLEDFAAFVAGNKAALENLLGIEIRRDLAHKPMSQLNAVLKLIGLGTLLDRTLKKSGVKTYLYRIDPRLIRQAETILKDRAGKPAWEFMAELHGWIVGDAADHDGDGFDDDE